MRCLELYVNVTLTSLGYHNAGDLMIRQAGAIDTYIPIRLEWSTNADEQEDGDRCEEHRESD